MHFRLILSCILFVLVQVTACVCLLCREVHFGSLNVKIWKPIGDRKSNEAFWIKKNQEKVTQEENTTCLCRGTRLCSQQLAETMIFHSRKEHRQAVFRNTPVFRTVDCVFTVLGKSK